MKPDVAPASGPRRWGSGVATIVGVILDKSWHPTGSWRYKPRLRSVGLEFLDRCTAWRRPANGKAIAERIAGRSSGPCWTSCASPRKGSKRPKQAQASTRPASRPFFSLVLLFLGLATFFFACQYTLAATVSGALVPAVEAALQKSEDQSDPQRPSFLPRTPLGPHEFLWPAGRAELTSLLSHWSSVEQNSPTDVDRRTGGGAMASAFPSASGF